MANRSRRFTPLERELLSTLIHDPLNVLTRGVLADYYEDQNEQEVADFWRPTEPVAHVTQKPTSYTKALLGLWRTYWQDVGLGSPGLVEPRQANEKALADLYHHHGYQAPARIFWVASPTQLAAKPLYTATTDALRHTPRRILASLSVREVPGVIRAQGLRCVYTPIERSIWHKVRSRIWWDLFQSGQQDRHASLGYGCHDAYWLGYYNYLLVVWRYASAISVLPLMKLALAGCGWYQLAFDHAVLSPPPGRLVRDARGQLRSYSYLESLPATIEEVVAR